MERKDLIKFLNTLQAWCFVNEWITKEDVSKCLRIIKISLPLDKVLESLIDLRLIKRYANGRYVIQYDPDTLTDEELDYILSELVEEDTEEYISEEELNAINLLVNKGYIIIKKHYGDK